MIGGLHSADIARPLGVLWGKSNAGGSSHLLLAHLLDTAAVAELLWDRYLAASFADQIDACCDGQGRELFSLVCGLHDVGKASPAFQSKDVALAQAVRANGLTWPELTRAGAQRWHHTLAGAHLLRRVLKSAGWGREAIAWVLPLVAGHHGVVPDSSRWVEPPERGHVQGLGAWLTAQDALVAAVLDALHLDLRAAQPSTVPSRGIQLALVGSVIMADWIASDDRQFPGIPALTGVSMDRARQRAAAAWSRLGLAGGWRPDRLAPDDRLVERRFGVAARPAQTDAVMLAEQMEAPGLLLLEAPMGEGKTEAALAAVEVLARRFGASGVFVGMPTQATSDPMFGRVRAWLRSVDPSVPLALLHGKRQFNPEWQTLLDQVRFSGVHDFGMDDVYGMPVPPATSERPGEVPAEWFLGRKRGLLVPVTVGTVDQLLHAATRTRHVMLRHAGLAGRVVVLDEVHAYDVYMAQFLFEALRWLADQRVPVVLLSATLPPALRADLVRAYLQGASRRVDPDLTGLPDADGYPRTTSACNPSGGPSFAVATCTPWRPSTQVSVEVLEEAPAASPDAVARCVTDAVQEGGCVLVVRNTVARAQQTYAAIRRSLGDDAVLLHARLTVGERADRAERVLVQLGRPVEGNRSPRPARLVVVATQLAEQSFDVDVDRLVTDLAPIDRRLQRVGRMHRHDRPEQTRPPALRRPRIVVSGMQRPLGAPPRFPPGSTAVYGEHLLLRAAALVAEAADGAGWSVPADVPGLVSRGYSDDPGLLADWLETANRARERWEAQQMQRTARAGEFLLAGLQELGKRTLAG
ncbi:MAG: CRISPR-associated helicase Cas3', partial [Actinomycetes bacterium]